MTGWRRAAVASIALASSAALAADLLPLKHGIYVPVGRPCKGASNAEIVSYWGGKASISYSKAECTVVKLSKAGNVYTLTDQCRDIASNDFIEGGPTVLKITGQDRFSMGDTSYRYCGPKVEF